MMAGLKKFWRREVAALLLLGLVTSGGVAFLNHRQAANVVVSDDTPAGPLGSAAGPEEPILTPDVWQPDTPETPTLPPPSPSGPTPTPAKEGSQTPTGSTSSPSSGPTTTTKPRLATTAIATPSPSAASTTPPPHPTSRTITISTTPRESYTEIIVTGGGCAGEDYGVTLHVRDSSGEPVDGDAAAATPDGSWRLEGRWGAEKPAGRYSFQAKCIHAAEEGGQTTVFEYEPATFDWTGHVSGE